MRTLFFGRLPGGWQENPVPRSRNRDGQPPDGLEVSVVDPPNVESLLPAPTHAVAELPCLDLGLDNLRHRRNPPEAFFDA